MKSTRWMLTALLVVASTGLFTLASSTPAEAYYCSARGTTGATGWGRSGSLSYARAIALRECAVRTQRGATCYIMYCN
jgi:hypothetical protein